MTASWIFPTRSAQARHRRKCSGEVEVGEHRGGCRHTHRRSGSPHDTPRARDGTPQQRCGGNDIICKSAHSKSQPGVRTNVFSRKCAPKSERQRQAGRCIRRMNWCAYTSAAEPAQRGGAPRRRNCIAVWVQPINHVALTTQDAPTWEFIIKSGRQKRNINMKKRNPLSFPVT